LLLHTARGERVAIEKHGHPVVVVFLVEEYEGLTEDRFDAPPSKNRSAKKKT
jgi:hypothetical protein